MQPRGGARSLPFTCQDKALTSASVPIETPGSMRCSITVPPIHGIMWGSKSPSHATPVILNTLVANLFISLFSEGYIYCISILCLCGIISSNTTVREVAVQDMLGM
jgi:hypothetical protein